MYAATVSTSHSLSQYLRAQHMIETAQRVVTFFSLYSDCGLLLLAGCIFRTPMNNYTVAS